MNLNWKSYSSDFKSLLRLALPNTVTQTFYSLMFPVALAFCGALGKDELDSASLALSIFHLVVLTTASAIRWGCAPFFAQVLDLILLVSKK